MKNLMKSALCGNSAKFVWQNKSPQGADVISDTLNSDKSAAEYKESIKQQELLNSLKNTEIEIYDNETGGVSGRLPITLGMIKKVANSDTSSTKEVVLYDNITGKVSNRMPITLNMFKNFVNLNKK